MRLRHRVPKGIKTKRRTLQHGSKKNEDEDWEDWEDDHHGQESDEDEWSDYDPEHDEEVHEDYEEEHPSWTDEEPEHEYYEEEDHEEPVLEDEVSESNEHWNEDGDRFHDMVNVHHEDDEGGDQSKHHKVGACIDTIDMVHFEEVLDELDHVLEENEENDGEFLSVNHELLISTYNLMLDAFHCSHFYEEELHESGEEEHGDDEDYYWEDEEEHNDHDHDWEGADEDHGDHEDHEEEAETHDDGDFHETDWEDVDHEILSDDEHHEPEESHEEHHEEDANEENWDDPNWDDSNFLDDPWAPKHPPQHGEELLEESEEEHGHTAEDHEGEGDHHEEHEGGVSHGGDASPVSEEEIKEEEHDQDVHHHVEEKADDFIENVLDSVDLEDIEPRYEDIPHYRDIIYAVEFRIFDLMVNLPYEKTEAVIDPIEDIDNALYYYHELEDLAISLTIEKKAIYKELNYLQKITDGMDGYRSEMLSFFEYNNIYEEIDGTIPTEDEECNDLKQVIDIQAEEYNRNATKANEATGHLINTVEHLDKDLEGLRDKIAEKKEMSNSEKAAFVVTLLPKMVEIQHEFEAYASSLDINLEKIEHRKDAVKEVITEMKMCAQHNYANQFDRI